MSKAASYDEAVRQLPEPQRAACQAIRAVKSRIPELRPVQDQPGVVFITFEDGSGAYVAEDGRVWGD